ncbi:amino acid ABC transporter permease [Cetobacterium sp. SF1]|uniref:amino acid ABC transporter permease n=1 Tax=unclassified Cetobacterium TaxID=2630983 RepID=UPI003CEFE3BA
MDNFIFILKGVKISIIIYLLTLFLSLPLGFILALLVNGKSKKIKNIIEIYTWIFRGTPILLQIFFIYYGLPIFGIRFNQFYSALITFTFNYSAYFCEIFRGGLNSIDVGQYDACKVLGFTPFQTLKRIVFPQVLNNVLPAISNEAISLIKDTSLISVIGMSDILRNSREIVTRDFTISPFIMAGFIYLLLSTIIILGIKKVEKKVEF